MTYSQIILNKGKEFSLLRFHPWVFSGAIAKKDQYLKDGDIVEVYSNKLDFLGNLNFGAKKYSLKSYASFCRWKSFMNLVAPLPIKG